MAGDKTPAEITSGTPSDTSLIHASQDAVSNDSRSHNERDISRLQGTAPQFSASKTYNTFDLVQTIDSIVYIALNNNGPGSFSADDWEPVATPGNFDAVSPVPENSTVFISESDDVTVPKKTSVRDISRVQPQISTFVDTKSYAVGDLVVFEGIQRRCVNVVAASGGTAFDPLDWVVADGVGAKNVVQIFSQADFPAIVSNVIPLANDTEYIICAPTTLSHPLFIDTGFEVMIRSFADETNKLIKPAVGFTGSFFITSNTETNNITDYSFNSGPAELTVTTDSTTGLNDGDFINLYKILGEIDPTLAPVINNKGTGYTTGNVITFPAPTSDTDTPVVAEGTVIADGSGFITGVTITKVGNGYQGSTLMSTSIATGSSGQITMTLDHTSSVFNRVQISGTPTATTFVVGFIINDPGIVSEGDWDKGIKALELEDIIFLGNGQDLFGDFNFSHDPRSEFFVFHVILDNWEAAGSVRNTGLFSWNSSFFFSIDFGFNMIDVRRGYLYQNTFNEQADSSNSVITISGADTEFIDVAQCVFDTASGAQKPLQIENDLGTEAVVNVLNCTDINFQDSIFKTDGGEFDETDAQLFVLDNGKQKNSVAGITITDPNLDVGIEKAISANADTFVALNNNVSFTFSATGNVDERFTFDGQTGSITYKGFTRIFAVLSYSFGLRNTGGDRIYNFRFVHFDVSDPGVSVPIASTNLFQNGPLLDRRTISQTSIIEMNFGDMVQPLIQCVGDPLSVSVASATISMHAI